MDLVRSAQFGEWGQVKEALAGAPAELPLDALLVEAVRGNAVDVVAELIRLGANVNAETPSGTAMLVAVYRWRPTLVTLLKDAGASLEQALTKPLKGLDEKTVPAGTSPMSVMRARYEDVKRHGSSEAWVDLKLACGLSHDALEAWVAPVSKPAGKKASLTGRWKSRHTRWLESPDGDPDFDPETSAPVPAVGQLVLTLADDQSCVWQQGARETRGTWSKRGATVTLSLGDVRHSLQLVDDTLRWTERDEEHGVPLEWTLSR